MPRGLSLAGSHMNTDTKMQFITIWLRCTTAADDGGCTLMSETHTTHHDAPDILSWARSGIVANTQTGYIVASLAWVGVPLRDSFLKEPYITLSPTAILTEFDPRIDAQKHCSNRNPKPNPKPTPKPKDGLWFW